MANCLFVLARAYIHHLKTGFPIITPTWFRISHTTYLRKERDKRHYTRLFKKSHVHGLKKAFILLFRQKQVHIEQGLKGYFSDLLLHEQQVRAYIFQQIRPEAISNVPDFTYFENAVAVHIRLGDYPSHLRTPIDWYANVIQTLQKLMPAETRFLLFSDATDEELQSVLQLENTYRVFFGNALADMVGISRCKLAICSDSTFSSWGVFLGNIPGIYCKLHIQEVLSCTKKLLIEKDPSPDTIHNFLTNNDIL